MVKSFKDTNLCPKSTANPKQVEKNATMIVGTKLTTGLKAVGAFKWVAEMTHIDSSKRVTITIPVAGSKGLTGMKPVTNSKRLRA